MLAKYKEVIQETGNNFNPSEFQIRQGTGVTDIDLDFFRSYAGWRQWHEYPILITSAYRPGDDGAHGRGEALDGILFQDWKSKVVPPAEQWRIATTWPFQGIGIYFDWSFRTNQGEDQQAVGLHCDNLSKKGVSRPLRWIRADGIYYYQSIKDGRFYTSNGQQSTTLEEQIQKFHSTG